MARTAAILLAAGSGARMSGAVADKVLARLGGLPIFSWSAAAFMRSGVADLYVVVYRDQRQMLELSALAPTPSLLVRGGRERQDSVLNALRALPDDIGFVFIHDCARPLVQPGQLAALHRVVDTVKEHRATSGGGSRLRTLERSRLWAMETPQVFSRDLITRAYARVAERGRRITDDAQAVEELGHAIALLENNRPNPKLTTPADLPYLEFLLAKDESP
jgi:2-C-methyl-D-erythritol 4-phosphate cytidylyltransferase